VKQFADDAQSGHVQEQQFLATVIAVLHIMQCLPVRSEVSTTSQSSLSVNASRTSTNACLPRLHCSDDHWRVFLPRRSNDTASCWARASCDTWSVSQNRARVVSCPASPALGAPIGPVFVEIADGNDFAARNLGSCETCRSRARPRRWRPSALLPAWVRQSLPCIWPAATRSFGCFGG
jgi:hypothetical protein